MSGLTWHDLEFSLGRHLQVMPDDEIFTLYVDEPDRPGFDPDFDSCARYVQFCSYDQGWVRCEVVSNKYLPHDLKHSVDDLIAMRVDGWTLPGDEDGSGSPNIYLDVEVCDAAAASARVMRVFREVWHVADAGGVTCDADALRGRHAFRVLEAPVDFRADAPLH
ncbi:TY-Chap domain-containing protein [Aeromicrobium stalagmiti]|uniref:TY-Chap domain-containing protein n=1 Tax=Aeromicrobium stalagmiti TaxID=2738988 RepID=UPI0015695FA6|nr:hypothetical protein [Aeromicrobium stalagmiti]NRQ50419.1 hypothetical protein [Aeromicrobium stalagmiti]